MGRRLIILGLLVFAFSACGGSVSQEEETLVIDLGQPTRLMLDSLEVWKSSNLDVCVREKQSIGNISTLALLGPEHLPDVFITDGLTGRFLAQFGRVLNLSSYTQAVPGLGYAGAAWAFPAERESVGLVVYDEGSTAEPCFLSDTDRLNACFADSLGQKWLQHMVAGDKKAAFTDSFFVERLSSLQQQMKTARIVSLDAFLSRKCSSVFAQGQDLYRLLDSLKLRDPERYAHLDFRPYTENAIIRGYDTGLFISSSMSYQPGKLYDCITLCEALSPEPEEPSDDTRRRLLELLDSSTHAAAPTHFLSFQFWNAARDKCFSELATGDKTLAEYAAILQDDYERYYLTNY